MAFSDEELAKRLRNMATDHELSGQYITAKVLAEAAARIMGLTHTNPDWHPSMTSNHDRAICEVIDFIVKNPFEGDLSGF